MAPASSFQRTGEYSGQSPSSFRPSTTETVSLNCGLNLSGSKLATVVKQGPFLQALYSALNTGGQKTSSGFHSWLPLLLIDSEKLVTALGLQSLLDKMQSLEKMNLFQSRVTGKTQERWQNSLFSSRISDIISYFWR